MNPSGLQQCPPKQTLMNRFQSQHNLLKAALRIQHMMLKKML